MCIHGMQYIDVCVVLFQKKNTTQFDKMLHYLCIEKAGKKSESEEESSEEESSEEESSEEESSDEESEEEDEKQKSKSAKKTKVNMQIIFIKMTCIQLLSCVSIVNYISFLVNLCTSPMNTCYDIERIYI